MPETENTAANASNVAALRADLEDQGVDTTDGMEVAGHLAEMVNMDPETLNELVANDLETRGEWPEESGISGSDIAEHMGFLGTEDLPWLSERIAHVATNGF